MTPIEFIAVALIAYSSSGAGSGRGRTASESNGVEHVYYLPFDFETYTAVTRENIRKRGADVRLRLGNRSGELAKLIRRSAPARGFDFSRVRLGIDFSSGPPAYVDKLGDVIIDGRRSKLSAADFTNVKRLIKRDWYMEFLAEKDRKRRSRHPKGPGGG